MGQHLFMVSADVFESLTRHKFEPFLPSLLTNVAHLGEQMQASPRR